MITLREAKKKYMNRCNVLEKLYGGKINDLESERDDEMDKIECEYGFKIDDLEMELEDKQDEAYEAYIKVMDAHDKLRAKNIDKTKTKKGKK